MERHTNSKHVRLAEPSLQLLASVRRLGIEAANDSKPAWISGCRLQYALIVITNPGGRDEHGPADANCIHLCKDFPGAEAIGPMGRALQFFHPGTVRPVDFPEVNL